MIVIQNVYYHGGFGIFGMDLFRLVCVLQMVGNDLGKGFMMVLW
jgi:hypothetical protein